ncbi:DMT family transporter [Zavarzinia sp. CC-PAN008]|uniref:DMT family transporter n=1 Tax=Zavarzinia sp. CC-PAN008 TaxID=3243332 RepID=UPI003F747220
MVERRAYGLTLVLVATLLWGLAGLFIRLVEIDAWSLVLWRSVIAAAALFVIVALHPGRRQMTFGRIGVLGAVISGVSTTAFVGAVAHTTVANVLVIYATLPFIAAGLAWLMMGERATRRVIVASTVSLAGVVVLGAASLRPGDLLGNALALLMTATFALLIILMRRHPTTDIAAVNAWGAVLAALAALPLAGLDVPPLRDLGVIALLALTTSVLAFLLFLMGGRHVPPAEAGLIGLLDVVLGPLWVWLAIGEEPGQGAWVGGSLILGAVIWYLWPSLSGRPTPQPDPVP